MQESEAILSELCEGLDKVSGQMKETASYFCQDSSKFKLEELLKELLNFIKELENALKVIKLHTLTPHMLSLLTTLTGEPPTCSIGGEASQT